MKWNEITSLSNQTYLQSVFVCASCGIMNSFMHLPMIENLLISRQFYQLYTQKMIQIPKLSV